MNALPPMDVAARAPRLRTRFADAGIDALLVTRLPNVRYLTGFSGSAATLLVTPDAMLVVTDGRYRTQMGEQLAAAGVDAIVEVGATLAEQHAVLARAAGALDRLGLEAHGITWAEQRTLAEVLSSTLVATEQLVESQRLVKDDGEVARIRAACAIGDDALAELLPTLGDGPTEADFGVALEHAMRRRGAAAMSFDPIVASGPNAAMPHHRPSERRIGHGELVVLDFGCVVDGYCSDITRTVSVGDPGADARRLWDLVAASQAAGRDAVAPGVACAAVDRASRDVIDAAGLGDAFVHGTGHGVGLEIHEAPRVARTASGTLDVHTVVTVEPGVYLPGVGGVRIEDPVVVTEDGAVPLTEAPKSLVVAPH
ncbi:MAG TPA: Xaa-Pro peptidase family protein [Acidimicrobiia bacterium]